MSFGDRVKWLFVGPHGLRWFWGLLVFILLIGLMQIGLAMALSAAGIHSRGISTDGDPLKIAMIEGVLIAVVIVATIIMKFIEGRPLGEYGFSGRRGIGNFVQGFIVGFLMVAALCGGLIFSGGLHYNGFATQGQEALVFGAKWAAAFLVVGIFEEITFRGYIFTRITRAFGFRASIIVTSVLFALAHTGNPGESPIGLATVVLVGLVLAYSIWKTGSLVWAIGYHFAWDWAETYVFGVGDSGLQAQGSLLATSPAGPDWLSGGATGPEGSALCLAVLIASALILHFGYKRPADALAPPAKDGDRIKTAA